MVGGHFAHLFHATAFVGGDLGSQRFGGAFHLFDTYFHSCQLAQQGATLLKAYQRRRTARHAQNSRCERKQFQPQSTITRAESAFALGTVIVGPFQVERAEHAFECFLVTAMILGGRSAGARQFRARMIAGVGVQPLFQCSRG
jgi:hypothetical protein